MEISKELAVYEINRLRSMGVDSDERELFREALLDDEILVECEGCDRLHPSYFGGDCRDDSNRF